MRAKLTTVIAACALVAASSSAAQAAPIPVAQYTFEAAGDVGAFQDASTGKCTRKRRQGMAGGMKKEEKKKGAPTMSGAAMAVTLGSGANSCLLRTSVVADSSDIAPDQIVSAVVAQGAGGSPKLQKQGYQGVFLRQSDTAGYELRVLPGAQKWQVFRDPKGTGAPALLGSGSGKFVKSGAKPNSISLRAFDFGGTSTSLEASINGRSVLSQTDSGMDQPDGRRNGISLGVKGTGAGTGLVGLFDTVTIQVPNPF